MKHNSSEVSSVLNKDVRKQSLFKKIFYLLIALIAAILFRSLLFQAFVIPSESMIPNLLVGDYLFVSKYSYGYSRFSFPFGLFGIADNHKVFKKSPQRGDVVVFKYPSDTSEDFIKRVMGVPGDKIQVIGGTVYINNTPLPEKIVGKVTHNGQQYIQIQQTLPEGKTITIYKDVNPLSIYSTANNTSAFYVLPNHYFMMGDNRDFSRDSRFSDVGQVPSENIEGKARLIFFSIDGYFLQFWRWNHIRFNRIFKTIE